MRDILNECKILPVYNKNEEKINEAARLFSDFHDDFGDILPLDEYPEIKTDEDLARFFDFANLLERSRSFLSSSPSKSIKCSDKSLEISLSVNDYCMKGCLDCISDSNTKGIQVPYSSLTGFSGEFFKSIKDIRFGMEGEPLLYSHSEKNLGDLMEFYLSKEIDVFTLSTGCPAKTPVVKNALKKISGISDSMKGFYPRLTYSLYPVGKNRRKLEQNDREFIDILKSLLPVSTIMNVQVRGDFFYKETYISKATKRFDKLMQENGFERKNPLGVNNKLAEYSFDGKNVNAYIQAFVYPSERLVQSEARGLLTPLKTYRLREVETSHVCHHMFNYDSIVLMSNGDVRLCEVIYSYADPKTIVKNIYRNDGEAELFEKLDEYNALCKSYFLQNFMDIMLGAKPTCLCKLNIKS